MMRLWGAYHAVAQELYGDAAKAESLCDMLKAVGLKEARPVEQRDTILDLLFG